jgi:hypothetical protein
VTLVKYSLTINTVKENMHKNLFFMLIPSGYKTRSYFIQNLSRFARWKSLHRPFCSMMRIFILLKSSRLWSDSLKCWLTGGNVFCKITPVSIQGFVEVLLRSANVLEATNRTLKKVNNICTLAINSTNIVYCFPVTLLVYNYVCSVCLHRSDSCP